MFKVLKLLMPVFQLFIESVPATRSKASGVQDKQAEPSPEPVLTPPIVYPFSDSSIFFVSPSYGLSIDFSIPEDQSVYFMLLSCKHQLYIWLEI